jgi:1-acyl-sn-glycerol-3-phosphate acyltransferase
MRGTPDMLRGLTTTLLLILNLALWGTLVLLGGIGKIFTRGEARRRVMLALSWMAERWVSGNNDILNTLTPTVWDIRGIEETRYDGHYLIISNHVSWVDIIALSRAFHGHAAFLRFFLKSVLIWFPFVGLACWALDFPFMKRYSPEYLEKHPEKRGHDLQTTRRAVQRYRNIPVAILNFVEGTRFTQEKHADQDSPYRHLLRPRIGGISFVLAALGEQLDAFFDVTLAYPGGDVRIWDFVTGRVPRIVVDARRVEIPPEFFDAAITQPGPERDRFKAWIDDLWRQKDERLSVEDGQSCVSR